MFEDAKELKKKKDAEKKEKEEKDKADQSSQDHEEAKEWVKNALERQVANFVRYIEQSDGIMNKWRGYWNESEF